MREERDIEPKTLAHLVSSTLYERRYGVTYIINTPKKKITDRLFFPQVWAVLCWACGGWSWQEQYSLYMLYGFDWVYQLCKRLCRERHSWAKSVRHVRVIVGTQSWARRSFWDDFTSIAECPGQRCLVRMGCRSSRDVSIYPVSCVFRSGFH